MTELTSLKQVRKTIEASIVAIVILGLSFTLLGSYKLGYPDIGEILHWLYTLYPAIGARYIINDRINNEPVNSFHLLTWPSRIFKQEA
ncbi:hypothetical protein VCHA53O466_50047 [Vibrio chagasii]|nr:hypothetical protein VCHA53O466_50047 [Vibrio chagasii]